MALVSGILLDYYTNEYVPNANVYAFTTSGGDLIGSTTADPVGMFSLDVPVSSGKISYVASVSSHDVSYSVSYEPYNNFINLFVRSSTSPGLTISGGAHFNINNSMLTTSAKVVQLLPTVSNMFAATVAGLDIIDFNTNSNVGYVERDGGFTSLVFIRNNSLGGDLLLGTSNSGVYRLELPVIFDSNSRDYTNSIGGIYSYSTSGLTSDNIMCMNSNSNDDILIGTDSGIDYYTNSGTTRYYLDYIGITGTSCCFISEYGDLYYSPVGSGLHVKYGPITDNWYSPDYVVVESGTGDYDFPLESNYINDVSVTSMSGGNHVFVASTSGFLYYEEAVDLNISASGSTLITNYP